MSERIETVVLDSEGLSAWVAQDRKLLAMLQVFHDMGADLVIGPTPSWKSSTPAPTCRLA